LKGMGQGRQSEIRRGTLGNFSHPTRNVVKEKGGGDRVRGRRTHKGGAKSDNGPGTKWGY